MRHLLSHTSGLPDYFLDAPPGDDSFTDRLAEGDFAYDIAEVVDRVRRLRPYFPPQDLARSRVRARYSDTNYQLLGALVAAATWTGFEQAVEDEILVPLALHDTWFAGRPRGAAERGVAPMWSGEVMLDRPRALASMAPDGERIVAAALPGCGPLPRRHRRPDAGGAGALPGPAAPRAGPGELMSRC